MALSKTYNPKTVESKIYKLWTDSGFFNPDNLPFKKRKSYCIVIPPPNITGSLHIGHALNTVCQDILIRRKRMQGYSTLWIPGIDHAGIAAQNVVERQLKKEGLTRFDLGRENFIKRVWKWKKESEKTILSQLKKLGASCDWSRLRFTMDKDYSISVKRAFLHYYKKGWIYQGERVINWCPRCQTSLSDLEIEYKEEKGKLYYIRYPLAKTYNLETYNLKPNIYSIVVATTRPETMFGDTAVAVNPKDKRYKNLIGKYAILPLVGRQIPIIADKLVDVKFGTGAVKVTPAHDLTDQEIGQKHHLETIQVIDQYGKMMKNTPYPGLKTIEAREKTVEALREKGFLEKIEDYNVSVPKCYRCHTTIEYIPSKQWFLKMDKLAKMAEKPVKSGEIKFYPKNFEKPYLDWLKNIKDWCISRQIWWGHQLPVWFCQNQTGISNSQFLISKRRKTKTQNPSGEKFIVSMTQPKKYPSCKKCKIKQVDDVLDTWFSSALWPFATLGWPKRTKDLKRFYPTDTLITDRGIINLWVARMIFSGKEFMGDIPFRNVYIHATILTKEGKRMSKSLGTGVDPIKLIEKYGADAVRFGIAWQITGNQDIRFTEDSIIMGKKFCNKIWNASRFVLLQIENPTSQKKNPQPKNQSTNFCARSSSQQVGCSDSKFKIQNSKLTEADKKILKDLKRTIKSVDSKLDNIEFGKAARIIYDFFWHSFCDQYIEKAKYQLQKPAGKQKENVRKNTKQILLYVLLSSLKLLHPFVPFITEEIYQSLPIVKSKSLMIEKWPNQKL